MAMTIENILGLQTTFHGPQFCNALVIIGLEIYTLGKQLNCPLFWE
jgi:hypothetical protein